MPAQSAEGASCSHLPRRVSQGRPAEACLFLELAGAPGTLLGGDCSPAQGQASQPRQGFLALGAQCCGVALQGPVTQLEPRRWPRQRLARTHRRPGWACEQGRVGPLGGILVGSRSLLLQGCSADAWHGLPVCLAWARRHQGGIGRAFSSALHVYVTCYLPCTNNLQAGKVCIQRRYLGVQALWEQASVVLSVRSCLEPCALIIRRRSWSCNAGQLVPSQEYFHQPITFRLALTVRPVCAPCTCLRMQLATSQCAKHGLSPVVHAPHEDP